MQVGPYRVLGELARGGMGVVYRAQGSDGAPVALKLLLAQRASDARAQQRFQLEVQALARLRHPNVVSILATGQHEGHPWLALELVEGESLEQRLRQGPLPVLEAIQLTQQLARALSYVHACGILHRDLKPGNVLVRGTQALLTDFGLVLDDQASISRITATGIFQGTPGYWAPEQAQGNKHAIGPRTDVYGLGGVLYACLTGRPPVLANSLHDYLERPFQRADAPRRLRAEVPEWLSELCVRCLATSPDARPDSADAVARALVLGDDLPRARSTPWGPLLAGSVVLALGGVGALGWALTRGGEPQPVEPVAELEPEPVAELEPERPLEETDVGALVEAGRAKLNAGDYAGALLDFARALELDPDDPRNWLGHAHALHSLDRFEEAVASYDESILRGLPSELETQLYADRGLAVSQRWQALHGAVDPSRAKRAQALLDSAGDHYNARRLEQAMTDLDRAVQLDPTRANGFVLRAFCKTKLKRYAAALSDYDRGLELDPSLVKAQLSRGVCHLQLGNGRQALADLERSLALGVDATRRDKVEELRDKAAKLVREDPDREAWEQAKAFVRQGAALVNDGRQREALASYARAQELDPKSFAPYLSRATCLQSLGRTEEAIADYGRAIARSPYDARIYGLRGGALASAGRLEEAVSDFTRATWCNPRLAEVVVARSKALRELGRLEEALADLDRALGMELPEDRAATARAWRDELAASLSGEAAPPAGEEAVTRSLFAAEALAREGRHAEAIRELDRVVAQEPNHPAALAIRGSAKSELGMHLEALTDLDRALELAPTLVAGWHNRGLVKRRLGRLEEAERDFTRGIELRSDRAAPFVSRGEIRRRLNRFEGALADFTRALELDPNAFKALEGRAEVQRQMGRLQAAYADASRCIERAPNANLYLIRGEVLRALGRPAEALLDYDQALQRGSSNAFAYVGRGEVKRSLKRFEEAIADFDRGEQAGLLEPLLFAGRGDAKRLLDRLPEALADFERALELDPRYGMAISGCAAVLFDLGRKDEALEAYARALELEPEQAMLWARRGDALRGMGRNAEAVRDFDKALELGLSPEMQAAVRQLRAEAATAAESR